MSLEAPVVDVVIPVRNGESTVLRAIASVLNQTFGRFRLYVVDDGSTDRTAELVSQVDDPRVTLTTIEHRGVSAARNVGAAMGSAPMIAFLDADDEVLPRWLEQMTRDPDALLVRCASLRCVDGKSTETVHPETGPLLPGSFVVARSVFESIWGYDERLAYSENTELGLRLSPELESRRAVVRFVNTPGTRRHIDVSPRAEKYGNATLRDAAELILRKHSSVLTREAIASFSAVAGVNSLLLGERERARRHLWEAIRRKPQRWRYGVRYIQACLPTRTLELPVEGPPGIALHPQPDSLAKKVRWRLYLEYRIARMRRRTPKSAEPPLLIFQMGKVASTAIVDALRSSSLERQVYQVHFLSAKSLRTGDDFYRSRYRWRSGCPDAHVLGHLLHRRLRSEALGSDMSTISVVRDPVAVNVSSFFQTLDWTHPSLASRLKQAPDDREIVGEVLAALRNDAWMENPLDWFRAELVEVLGVPLFEHSFPAETGYQILQGTRSACVVLRYEDIGRVFSNAMCEFLGISNCTLGRRNTSGSKYYSTAHAAALHSYRPSDEQMDRLYGSSITRHFYTDAEIAAFRAEWCGFGERRLRS